MTDPYLKLYSFVQTKISSYLPDIHLQMINHQLKINITNTVFNLSEVCPATSFFHYFRQHHQPITQAHNMLIQTTLWVHTSRLSTICSFSKTQIFLFIYLGKTSLIIVHLDYYNLAFSLALTNASLLI